MQYTFKNLEEKGLKKSFVYETLKHSLPFSKQYKDNKRIFDDNDLKMFQEVKQFGIKQTV